MKLGVRIFWHSFFWICSILFFVFIAHSNGRYSVQHEMIFWGLFGVINISLFYLNFLLLIPLFFNKKQYWLYILSVFIAIFIYGVGKYGVGLVFEKDILIHMRPKGRPEATTFVPYFISTLFSSLVFLFLSFVLKLSVDWILNERIQRDLENQRLSAELAFLKSQINPHFLFNSLNSIYSLAYQKSDTTPEAILKLSEIMRYMLYECNDNKVDLTKELQYLQNFIDLQKIRFGNKAYIDFKIEGKVTNQKIVPLLLIAFIENAFKYGINPNFDDCIVEITLQVTDTGIRLYVFNKKVQDSLMESTGIGINNTSERLKHLYPEKHILQISENKETYSVTLSIQLV